MAQTAVRRSAVLTLQNCILYADSRTKNSLLKGPPPIERTLEAVQRSLVFIYMDCAIILVVANKIESNGSRSEFYSRAVKFCSYGFRPIILYEKCKQIHFSEKNHVGRHICLYFIVEISRTRNNANYCTQSQFSKTIDRQTASSVRSIGDGPLELPFCPTGLHVNFPCLFLIRQRKYPLSNQ